MKSPNPIGRLRLAGKLEGISFILLLFVAMPLKYLAGQPMAVRVIGMAHGILFLAYCFCLLQAKFTTNWPLKRVAGLFVAALLPFGPFIADRRLKREEWDWAGQ